MFFLQNILMTFLNIFKLGYNLNNCSKFNIFKSHMKKKYRKKYLFLSFYHKIVCKNIVCELGLRVQRFLKFNWRQSV